MSPNQTSHSEYRPAPACTGGHVKRVAIYTYEVLFAFTYSADLEGKSSFTCWQCIVFTGSLPTQCTLNIAHVPKAKRQGLCINTQLNCTLAKTHKTEEETWTGKKSGVSIWTVFCQNIDRLYINWNIRALNRIKFPLSSFCLVCVCVCL